MSIPPLQELLAAAKQLVYKARDEGILSRVTPRMIRQDLEAKFKLEEGTLEEPDYKNALKTAIKDAVRENGEAVPSGEAGKPQKIDEVEPSQKNDKGQGKAVENVGTADKGNEKKGEQYEVQEEAREEQTPPSKRRPLKKSGSHKKEEETKIPSARGKKKTSAAAENSEEEDEVTPVKRRKSSFTTARSKSKKKRVESEPEDEDEDEDEDEERSDHREEGSKKKRNLSSLSSKAKSKERVRAADNKKYKSLEHVPTSDMEQDELGPVVVGPPVLTSIQPAKAEKMASASPKKSKTTAKPKSDTTPRQLKPVSAKPSSSGTSKTANAKAKEEDEKSSSEMSVVIDELPKKKRKSSGGGEKKVSKPKEKKTNKSSSSGSKEEETIKRLKALVVACGTRRVWAKVFQGLDTPQQQIRKLKEILTELGMTGRYSMEQAKAIREKRELEQELQDVREFEQKIVGQSSRRRNDAPKKSLKDISSDSESEKEDEGNEEEDEEEEGAPPKRRKMNARRSIMAFLEDQSDEE